MEIRTEWVNQINSCIKFVFEFKGKVQPEDQLIEVIDDEANQIKVHKKKKADTNKKTPNSNLQSPGSEKSINSERKISLFDIKSSH